MFASAWNSFLENTALQQVHRPLEWDGAFRLIQVVPDTTIPSQISFRIVLQNFSLSDAPLFHVLSYSRGPSLCHDIVNEWARDVNCHHFGVTEAQPGVRSEPEELSEESWSDALASRFASVLPAVSPVTSTDADMVSIKVNKGHVKVHQSVVDFLRMACQQQRYRPRDPTRIDAENILDSKKQGTYLWVDCICINTEDSGERARQAAQLGNIYRAGEKTIVWLSDNEPPELVDWGLREFIPRHLDGDAESFDAIWDLPLKGAEAECSAVDEVAQRWQDGLLHFCTFLARHEILHRHPWVQEVVLGQNVELACGRLSWDWMVLERFIVASAPAARQCLSTLISKGKRLKATWRRMQGVITEMESYGLIRKLWVTGSSEARRDEMTKWFGPLLSSQKGVHCEVHRMMRILRGRKFRDKRDAIYGWMALKELGLPGHRIYRALNYTTSAQQVYTQFTKSLLAGMPVLDVLNDVGERKCGNILANLPSWVPDYSQPAFPVPLHHQIRDNGSVGFDATLTRTRTSQSARVAEFDGNCLVVAGIQLDIIHGRGPDFPTHMASFNVAPIEWLLQMSVAVGETYGPTGQPAHEALSWTVVADSFILDGPQTHAEAFRGLWAILLQRRMQRLSKAGNERLLGVMGKLTSLTAGEQWIPTTREAVDEVCDTINNSKPPGALFQAAKDLLSAVAKTLPARAAYIGRKKYLGVGYRDLQAGDEVWLLEGGRTPFVLRRGPDGHRLVGETYVHGFMNGEGWTPEDRAALQRVSIA
ncbi:hypothetical protein AK830_g11599 [Neonectria ditissima]|uniref:Heterokaryon incompatibility domain-containing protein n=1 Tax=Neonectria ditissima TaxID=78410 RepID=A0A0P7ALY4_9HYPO|nr:hypothetical protein AK830_g11599 [Neonectria ditissima]